MKSFTLSLRKNLQSWTLFDAAKLLVTFGILLRLVQLLTNQGLGEAEGHLVINFARRDLAGMFKPLDHGQVAPILFLLIEKINTIIFGLNEYALRYFVFLLSSGALILFYFFLKKHTNGWVTFAGVLLMGVDRSIILLSSVAKQYSGDLMVAILLYYILFLSSLTKRKRILTLGISGAAAIWFSHPVIFVLAAIGVYLLFDFFSLRSERTSIAIAYLLWAASFGALYFITIAGHPSTSLMTNYWNAHFMPLMPATAKDLLWFGHHFRDMISNMLGFSPKHFFLWIPYGGSFVAGIWHCFRNNEKRFLLWTAVPIIIHLIASGLRTYPFDSRLIAYLSFPVILFIAYGTYHIMKEISVLLKTTKVEYVTLAVLVLVTFAVSLFNFPYPTEDVKKSLEVVKRNFKPGDKIYVYAPMDASYEFYGTKFVPAGTEVYYGRNSREDYTGYDRQVGQLSGRVWFVFSHLYTNPQGLAEDDYIVHVAAQRGPVLIKERSFNASVYLVDLRP